MKQFALSIFACMALFVLAPEANAQWVRTYRPVYRRVYQPMFVAPPVTRVYRAPTFVAPPVTRVYRAPMVVYQPSTIVYSRNRPILGGTVVNTRPAYRRSVIW